MGVDWGLSDVGLELGRVICDFCIKIVGAESSRLDLEGYWVRFGEAFSLYVLAAFDRWHW